MLRFVKHYEGQHDQKDHGNWAGKTSEEMRELLRGYSGFDTDLFGQYEILEGMSAREYIDDYMQDALLEEMDVIYQQWAEENPDLEEGPSQQELQDRAYESLEEAASEILEEKKMEVESLLVESIRDMYSVSGSTPEGEWYADVVDVMVWSGEAQVTGQFYVDGEYAGNFERTLTANDAYRALLVIEDEYAGLGIAQQFNHHEEMGYLASGLSEVRITAADLSEGDFNKPPGTYVWGSQGYDWDGGASGSVRRAVANYIDKNPEFKTLPRSIQDTITDVRTRLEGSAGGEDYPTPREITQLGRMPGEAWWPGKSIMAHSGASIEEAKTGRHEGPQWSAVKRLDDPDGLRVSLGEIRSKKAREEAQQAIQQHVAAWRQMNPQLDFGVEFITVNGQPVPLEPTDGQVLQLMGM